MKSIKEIVAVTEIYSNIRVVELLFLCISSFQGCFSAYVKENVSNGRETQLLFKSTLQYNIRRGLLLV